MEEAPQGVAPPPGAPPGYVVTSPAGVKARVNGDGGHEEEEEIVGSVGRRTSLTVVVVLRRMNADGWLWPMG